MIRLWLSALLSLVLALNAQAQGIVGPVALSPAPVPGWILKGAQIDCDFSGQRYYNCPPDITFPDTRSSAANAQSSNGIFYSFASAVPRITDNGYIIESGVTNELLWSRDLTQIATWVPTTMTTALNAVGIDGTLNSATRLTAGAANSTILQTNVLGSITYTYSVYLKRVTGSGNIQITTDGGTAWTNCPTLNTSTFVLCQKSQLLSNPISGIRIVTNGDVVIADGNQLEIATIGVGVPGATSPIFTTTVNASRLADIVLIQPPFVDILKNRAFSFMLWSSGVVNTSSGGRVLSASTDNNFIRGNNLNSNRNTVSLTDLTAVLGTGATNTAPGMKMTVALDRSGRSYVTNNGTLLTDANTASAANTTFSLGNLSDGSAAAGGYYKRFTIWSRRLLDTELNVISCITGNC